MTPLESLALTRRQLVQRGATGITILSLPGMLAACGGGGKEAAAVASSPTCSASPTGRSTSTSTRRRRSGRPSSSSRKTGIRVDYFEEINDNAEYFAKVQGPLSQGQGIDRDIFVFTDNSRFPGLLIGEGWVQKLDKELIPNVSNLIDAQASRRSTPTAVLLPWQSGMTGIAWNEATGRSSRSSSCSRGPKLKGKVSMLMEMADSVGLVMLANGDDPATVTDETFDRATERVQAAVDSARS